MLRKEGIYEIKNISVQMPEGLGAKKAVTLN